FFLPGGNTATESRNTLFPTISVRSILILNQLLPNSTLQSPPKLAVKSIVSLVLKENHIAAYMLLALAGNESPSVADIKAVLSSVGIDAETERLEKLIAELEGKNLQELIAEGSAKLASVPSGGAGAAAAAPAAGGAANEAAPEAAKEEEKEESDDDMGFGLFD
ncbi:hypothetical protein N7507_007192, partial [Penicillium longicatenatum]